MEKTKKIQVEKLIEEGKSKSEIIKILNLNGKELHSINWVIAKYVPKALVKIHESKIRFLIGLMTFEILLAIGLAVYAIRINSHWLLFAEFIAIVIMIFIILGIKKNSLLTYQLMVIASLFYLPNQMSVFIHPDPLSALSFFIWLISLVYFSYLRVKLFPNLGFFKPKIK